MEAHVRASDVVRRVLVVGACVVALLIGGTSPATAAPVPTSFAEDIAVERYVIRVYRDLFQRAPDYEGLITWRNAILCGRPRVVVANAITSSVEYRSRLVSDAYLRFLGRGPDATGLRNWVAALASGWTVARIDSGFLASQEHYLQAGSTPAGWVGRLYQDVLRRGAAPSEVDFWVRELARGSSRSQVALGFLLSTEHLSTVVDGYYMDLLGRHLDPTGQQTWVSALQRGAHDEEIIGGIIASAEYWGTASVAAPASIVLSPSDVATAGQPTTFTVTSNDQLAWRYSDVTAEAQVTVDGSATWCVRAVCRIPVAGRHAVGVSWRGLTTSGWVSVDPGPVASLVLTPATASVPDGASVVLAVAGRDAFGNATSSVPADAVFAVDGDPTACVAARCRPVGAGAHHVTAALSGSPAVTGTATIQVAAPGPVRSRAFVWDGYREGQPDYRNEGLLGTTAQWASVSASTSHTLAIKTDGSVWSWGDNRMGQLGDGTRVAHDLPEPVGTRTDWAAVAAGSEFSVAVAKDGSLWRWGLERALWPGGDYAPTTPQRIGTDADWSSVVAGGTFALATKRDGSLWSWGEDEYGQLGDGTTANRSVPARVGTGTWTTVAAGYYHAVAIASDGSLWTWGARSHTWQVDLPPHLTPTRVGVASDWRAVAAGYGVAAAILSDGSLWTWGDYAFTGQLGDGTTDLRLDPVQVGTGTSWAAVAFGSEHTVALDSAGGLWRWGTRELAQPGDPDVLLPERVGVETGWTSVGAGSEYTIALRP
jgi:hypothetical protein